MRTDAATAAPLHHPARARRAPIALLLACAVSSSCAVSPRAPAPSIDKASSRVDTFRVAMPGPAGGERTIRVYVPPGYARENATYPVLYLQDAQNLFAAGAYGDWLVDETVDRLVATGAHTGIIVVGVDNGPRRWDEYGPWVNRRMHDWVDSAWARSSHGGDAAAYVRWLAGTLKPEIDRRYRTRRDRENTGIGGSSMGGLVALYAGLEHPEVFSKVMAMSPAVWFAEQGGPWLSSNALLARIRARTPPRDVRFWIDVGTAERSRDTDPAVADTTGARVTYPRAYVEGARAAAAALRAGGVPVANLRLVVEEGAVHHESAWARRLEPAVRWLYR